MNVKKWTKVFLSLIAILMMITVMPVTYADNTQSQQNNQEFQATHATLVNFVVYLKQTLSDFDEYNFDDVLLENLQKEIELASTVTHRSTVVGTVEYSLGFLKFAYSSLLKDAIENEINTTHLLLKELDQLTEEDLMSLSWSDLQKQLENVTDAFDDVLQELDLLEIEFDNDSPEDEEQDENLEVLVIELPDLTSDLREIFDTLVDIREELVFSQSDILETSAEASDASDEIEVHEPVVHMNNVLEKQVVNHCPHNNDECLAVFLQVARHELRNLLINHDVRNVDPLTFENATKVLSGDDLDEIVKLHDRLLGSLES